VDVAATTGHKWLLGPEGSGLLYLSPRAREVLVPARAGARSVARPFAWDHLALDFAAGALAWECGTLNMYGILGLGAALELLSELGAAATEARVLAHAGRLAEGLTAAGYRLASPRGAGETSGIVSLAHPRRAAEEVVAAAAAEGVVVSARAGRVRLSPHVYNSGEELDRAVAVLASL
jgi:selenocysteine lyase/cysteine desulfurase